MKAGGADEEKILNSPSGGHRGRLRHDAELIVVPDAGISGSIRRVSRHDRRLLSAGLFGVVIALAASALLRHVPWAELDVKWWATTLQVVGAGVAFVGFWNAYVRARYDISISVWLWRHVLLPVWRQMRRFARWIKWLLGVTPPTQHVVISPIGGTISATMGMPTVSMSGHVGVNPESPLEQQIRQVAALAEDAMKRLTRLENTELPRIERRIDAAEAGAEQLAAETLAQLRAELEELRRLTNQAQVLDLRWAIGGLGVTVVGIFLGYWG